MRKRIELVEHWQAIKGYESYEVSDFGRIRSYRKTQSRLLVQVLQHNYFHVTLYDWKGGKSRHLVHRLVMLAFCGDSDLQVNHRDGNTVNNCLINLEYVTGAENMAHARDVLKRLIRPDRRFTIGQVRSMRSRVASGITMAEIAREHHVTHACIWFIVNRKSYKDVI